MGSKYHSNRFDKTKKKPRIPISPKIINIENIEKALEELDIDLPLMKNHKWIGEDGQKYSSWEISTPTTKLHTGDGGAELILREFLKQANEIIR